jgi:sigma-B regulation protein RsbU (phosphoserine phosphatase)
MNGPTSWPRPLRLGLAIAFAAAMTGYSGLWMYGVRREATAELGVDFDYRRADAAAPIVSVKEGGAAGRAGVRAGDRIRSIDDRPLTTQLPLGDAIYRGRPGQRVRLVVERPGAPAPLTLDAVLDAPSPDGPRPLSRRLVEELLNLYPVLFLVVAVAVLLLRVDDPNAWRLALVFAGFIAGAPYQERPMPPALHPFAYAFLIFFDGTVAAWFLYFFSVFPASSPLDRRLPWLKKVWLGVGLAVTVPLTAYALLRGTVGPVEAWAIRARIPPGPILLYYFGGYGLGLASLVANAVYAAPEARRKSRVIVWGTLGGFGPALVMFATCVYLRRSPWELPFWIWASCVLAMSLIPISFAYAVVRHRVLELPVLLRRSARYLLVQRGFVGCLVLLGAGATLFFAVSFARYLGPRREALAIGLGAGFGTVLVWTGTELQRRVRERIDRAFFRSAYDARHILEELAQQVRQATSREGLAVVLERHVLSALRPEFLAVYLEGLEGQLRSSSPAAGGVVPTLAAGLPALGALARRGETRELVPSDAESGELLEALAPLRPECLVPILGRAGRLTGLLALGPRLSEEPYSREDKRLLASVANQAGVALDAVRMGEQIAARLEGDRRAAHEMELAKQVQTKLLPQRPPLLKTVECAGRCLQARAVGGDYFDFLDLGDGRLGLVLADVSGKGFPAALLMAGLQASLRSRVAHELADLPASLGSVNQLLFSTSETNRFATLFLGLYDDATRRLTYANCGHNPPVILRAGGSIDRLQPTAPVVGLFETWECGTGEVQLREGDLLVLFSDGVTEAWSDDGVEFGESRLVAVLQEHRSTPLDELLSAVLARVREFSGSEQADDQTLLVARVR